MCWGNSASCEGAFESICAIEALSAESRCYAEGPVKPLPLFREDYLVSKEALSAFSVSISLTTAPAETGQEGLEDLYRGVLLGVAAGNCLGIPAESMDRPSLLRRFPGGLQEVDRREKSLPWDDDLAQTVILAEAFLEHGQMDLDDLGRRLVRWARENGRGMGNLTRRVIRELESGTPASAAARRVWEGDGDPRGRPAGNGAVMRCAPVALRWRMDSPRLVIDSATSALVTHYDPRCVWSTVAFNCALEASLRGSPPDLGRLANSLDEVDAPSEVGETIRKVQSAALADLDLDAHADWGYTLKAMQAGLWCLLQEGTFEKILIDIVNAGGDTDTNGAVAGAALGSRFGASGIPPRWLDNIRETDRLVMLSDALLKASEQS